MKWSFEIIKKNWPQRIKISGLMIPKSSEFLNSIIWTTSQDLRLPKISECHILQCAEIVRYWEKLPRSISSWFKLKKFQVQKWRRAQEKTIEYIKAQSGIFNFVNVRNYIKSETGIEVSWQSITSFLKNKLGFCNKRVSPRPSARSIPKNNLKRILFWLEFVNLIKPEHVIVNIDETPFTRSTKINYSWFLKGVWWNTNNLVFVGSLSLIAAITSKGD